MTQLPDAVDLVITGGSLVDGSGSPARPGTVGVLENRLYLGDVAWRPAAGRTIDAGGKVVAPGFIDLHSHGGLVILADPRHEPKVRQGVTTEVIGVDGNGYAPFMDRSDLEAFVELNGGLDGHPEIAYDWDSVVSYIGRYDRGQAVNVAVLIGNSALRIGAIGRSPTSFATRSAWSVPTRPSLARSRRRAPTALSRASSGSSCATSGCSASRRRCAG